MAINTKKYIESYLKIRDKNAKIIQFRLNAPQRKLYDAIKEQAKAGKPVRVIILKARQMGFSTLTEAMIFKRTVTKRNVTSSIVAHKAEASNNLFNMSKLFYDHLPQPMQPERKASNAKELVFDNADGTGLKSKIKVYSAGGDGIGRSDTIQNLHISELAFFPGDVQATMTGLMQAVPQNADTMVIIESTANGFDYFKEQWDKAAAGENDFIPVFCAWWELEEYRRTPDPDFRETAEEKKIRELYNLDAAQLQWRRWAIANLCGGDVQQFKQEYPACPEEAFISTGACIFDKEAIIARLQQLPEPKQRIAFDYKINAAGLTFTGWHEEENAPVTVYEEPKTGVPYVIGGDTAGEGSDWFVGQVLDNVTGKQVAVLRQRTDEDEYTHQMMCLGYYYNTALLGIESNFSTFPNKECARLGYPNLYTREATDTYTGRLLKTFGFRTDTKTRPAALAEIVRCVREHPEMINDGETLREMLVFVKDAHGKAAAMAGKHDDCVISYAIAHAIRHQQDATVQKAEENIEEEEAENEVESFLEYGTEW